MRVVGRIIFVASCLVAAFFLVERPEEVRWGPFAGAIIAALGGVVLMRQRRARPRAGGALRAEDAPAVEALSEVLAWVRSAPRDEGDLRDLSGRLDHDVKPALRRVERALGGLRDRLGITRYARFMDGFARGERALNRAWSAAADGYVDEAREQLDIADTAFSQAQRELPRGTGTL